MDETNTAEPETTAPPQQLPPTSGAQPSLLTTWKDAATKFFNECSRVLKITKKPSNHEFWTTVKITGLGILVIGLLGFLISTLQIVVRNIVVG